MTLVAERWLVPLEPSAQQTGINGAMVVWRWELSKMSRQWRIRVFVLLCLLTPFITVNAFLIQNAVPVDTLFGQWVHSSGFAVPLVILGFAGLWVLPLLTSMVSGDIFSSEDHFGTWKAVLTRSRTRGEIFAGKLAAAFTYTLVMIVALAVASMLAGFLMGTQPVVGLSGQVVSTSHAVWLVAASWATQIPPLLGFCAVSVVLSVLSRNSVVGIVGPLVLGLAMQLVNLINMPELVHVAMLVTPFFSWHGFWVAHPFYGPLYQGLVTSAVWFVLCIGIAWVAFRNRSMTVS